MTEEEIKSERNVYAKTDSIPWKELDIHDTVEYLKLRISSQGLSWLTEEDKDLLSELHSVMHAKFRLKYVEKCNQCNFKTKPATTPTRAKYQLAMHQIKHGVRAEPAEIDE